MPVVETYIGPSTIHGIGVFAACSIRAGTLVWIFDPAIDQAIATEQLAKLPEKVRDVLLSRSFLDENGRTILSRDHGVFLNHSETPNLSGGQDGSIAIRDIVRGEELTEDYSVLPPGACRAFLDGPPSLRPANTTRGAVESAIRRSSRLRFLQSLKNYANWTSKLPSRPNALGKLSRD